MNRTIKNIKSKYSNFCNKFTNICELSAYLWNRFGSYPIKWMGHVHGLHVDTYYIVHSL